MASLKTVSYLYHADRLGAQWKLLEEREARLEKEFKRQAGIIQSYLRNHGSRPKRAPGMLAALGAVYELAAMFARKRLIDDAKAAEFLAVCPKRWRERALRREVIYSVPRGAEKFILEHANKNLIEFWRGAVKTKRLPARIRVRELTAIEKARLKREAKARLKALAEVKPRKKAA
jgi:hypothetical protein